MHQHMGRTQLGLLAGLMLLLSGFPGKTVGQDYPRALLDYDRLKDSGTTSDLTTVSLMLTVVVNELETHDLTTWEVSGMGAADLSHPLVRVNEIGDIQTYIYVSTVGVVELEELEAYQVSIEIVNLQLGMIQAWVPYDRIAEVAQRPFVKRITPSSYAVTRLGRETTEGDAILRAQALRARGFDGSGVKVGVISDGVDNRAAAQATGDLPANITIVTYAGSGDEGTAMLEIVHDLSPGAELGFCGPTTSLEMIDCVNDLAGIFGADIIVDDLGFFLEPYFEDGPIAQAVTDVVPDVVYVSATGNDAEMHYQAAYVHSGDAFNSHDFGGGDTTLPIEIPQGGGAVLLQWSTPFGMRQESGDNYKLCLTTNAAGTTTLFCSSPPNVPFSFDNPIEVLSLRCDTPRGCSGHIQIRRVAGKAQELEMFFLDTSPTQFNVAADSVFGHPAVPGVLATAAIAASDPGNDTIEDFSSQGPATILFPVLEIRQKPDIAAIHGVRVTGAGGFPRRFFGTSAAAPHVAGVAALLRGGYPVTAGDIVDVLKNSAVDVGGVGRIDALAAAQQLSPDGEIDLPVGDVTITVGDAVTFAGTGMDLDGHTPLTFAWHFGSGASGSTLEDPGTVTFRTAGTFSVTFTVTDSRGVGDPTPDTRTIAVNRPSGRGGGCTLHPGAQVDFAFVGLVAFIMAHVASKRRRQRLREALRTCMEPEARGGLRSTTPPV